MISNASLSAFSTVAGSPRVGGAAVSQVKDRSPPAAQGLQGKPGAIQPGQLVPGQILPRGSLLDRSV